MSYDALCIILNTYSNPLKGVLSYYNFFLQGEISKLIYKNIISIKATEKIILYKNNINKFFPEKIIFFICFNDHDIGNVIIETLNSLKIAKACIVRGESDG
jgi:hypothetical protein